MTTPRVRCWHTPMTTERIADHVKFACWVPNVSGRLVTGTIEQRTDWSYDDNVTLARAAKSNGFEYALTQVRCEASYGAEYQHESTSFSLALLLATERLKVIRLGHRRHEGNVGGFLVRGPRAVLRRIPCPAHRYP
ncbi:hypothetical protein HNP40_003967 [Mycobacteroides chelonae]|nr:hypothetical protein [Mycobacteroides chelonae]